MKNSLTFKWSRDQLTGIANMLSDQVEHLQCGPMDIELKLVIVHIRDIMFKLHTKSFAHQKEYKVKLSIAESLAFELLFRRYAGPINPISQVGNTVMGMLLTINQQTSKF